MSFKCYDGLLARDEDPFAAAAAMRGVLEPLFLKTFEALCKAVAATVEEKPDLTWARVAGVTGDRWQSAIGPQTLMPLSIYDVVEELHEQPAYTGSPFAIGYTVCLLPNSEGTAPLVRVFGEHANVYERALIDAGIVTAYGYWDNADPEEGVSAEEWDRRRRAWNIAAEKAPAEVGLTFSMPSGVTAYSHVQPLKTSSE